MLPYTQREMVPPTPQPCSLPRCTHCPPVGKKQHTVAKTVALYRTTQAPREAVNRFTEGIWSITTEFALENRCTYSEIVYCADETAYDIV